MELGRRESRRYACPLDSATFPAGEYSVQFEYFSHPLIGTPENLKSNVVIFRVDR